MKRFALDRYIDTGRSDGMGTIYVCAICNDFCAPRMQVHVKGWAKAAVLRKMVRDHIIECHPTWAKVSES